MSEQYLTTKEENQRCRIEYLEKLLNKIHKELHNKGRGGDITHKTLKQLRIAIGKKPPKRIYKETRLKVTTSLY